MSEWNIGEMNRRDRIRVTSRELFGDGASPISAMRSIFLVAESFRHQVRPNIVDLKNRSHFRRFVGKTIPRQIRNDDVERIFLTPAECGGIGEHRNDFRETIKRIGIAVCEDKRKRIWSLAALVNKVNSYVVDCRFEMLELI